MKIYQQAPDMQGGRENNFCISGDLGIRVMTFSQVHDYVLGKKNICAKFNGNQFQASRENLHLSSNLEIRSMALDQGHDRPLCHKEDLCKYSPSS